MSVGMKVESAAAYIFMDSSTIHFSITFNTEPECSMGTSIGPSILPFFHPSFLHSLTHFLTH